VAILDTEVGKMGLDAVLKGQAYYEMYADEHPEEAMALEGMLNLSAFGLTNSASGVVEREMRGIVGDVLTKVTPPKVIDDRMTRVVEYGIYKGIRPKNSNKTAYPVTEKYLKDAKGAVEAIIENKNKFVIETIDGVSQGELPQSLWGFSQAIFQTRNEIFKQYNDLAVAAGNNKFGVDDIVKELDQFASNSNNRIALGRSFAREALEKAEDLAQRGEITVLDAQDMLQKLNAQLKMYYDNPTYENYLKNVTNSIIANNLRKKLDDAITTATGTPYQPLKNTYGQLKAIEAEVNKRAVVDARANPKGLIDFSDIFSSAQAVGAVANQNVAMFGVAGTAKVVTQWYKLQNDPNLIIKKMFENAEALHQKKLGAPQSQLFQNLQQYNVMMGRQNMQAGTAQKTQSYLNSLKKPSVGSP